MSENLENAENYDDFELEGDSVDFELDDGNADNQAAKLQAQAMKTAERHIFRRMASERQLEGLLDWEFEPGAAYHVISAGDVDALSFLKFALRQQPCEYVALSTWCMLAADADEIRRLIELGRIERLDSYVDVIFKSSYSPVHDMLIKMHRAHGGRVAIFRNHMKAFVGFGQKFDFVIETSANINTNPRAENTVITINTDLARFYKDFYDSIVSFVRDFDGWQKYELARDRMPDPAKNGREFPKHGRKNGATNPAKTRKFSKRKLSGVVKRPHETRANPKKAVKTIV